MVWKRGPDGRCFGHVPLPYDPFRPDGHAEVEAARTADPNRTMSAGSGGVAGVVVGSTR